MFLTDADIKTALSALLKMAEAGLPDYWDVVITAAHTAAYQDILGGLMSRGFRKDQVDSWDRGGEFEKDISIFWCLARGGAYAEFGAEAVKALDRRKELATVLVFAGGVWIKPSGDQPGLVTSSGPNIAGGVFNFPDPDDPRVGEVTRW